MTPQAFYARCAAHDWHFIQGGITRWRAGNRASAELSALAEGDTLLGAILSAWEAHAYSGPRFGCDSVPRPTLAQFVPPVSTFPGEPAEVHPQQLSLIPAGF